MYTWVPPPATIFCFLLFSCCRNVAEWRYSFPSSGRSGVLFIENFTISSQELEWILNDEHNFSFLFGSFKMHRILSIEPGAPECCLIAVLTVVWAEERRGGVCYAASDFASLCVVLVPIWCRHRNVIILSKYVLLKHHLGAAVVEHNMEQHSAHWLAPAQPGKHSDTEIWSRQMTNNSILCSAESGSDGILMIGAAWPPGSVSPRPGDHDKAGTEFCARIIFYHWYDMCLCDCCCFQINISLLPLGWGRLFQTLSECLRAPILRTFGQVPLILDHKYFINTRRRS